MTPQRLAILLIASCVVINAARSQSSSDPTAPVQIIADPSTRSIVEQLNHLYAQNHPQQAINIKTDSSGNLGLAGITYGLSPFSVLPRAAYPLELRPFLQTRGHAPLDIVIAHNGCSAPGLYVNAQLPNLHLTWNQVARILTRGTSTGDITQWEQLGVRSQWSHHAIHIYGPPDDGTFVSALRHASFDGNPLALRYEELPTAAAIVDAVSKDIYAIGLIEAWDAPQHPLHARLIPIATSEAQAPGSPSAADLKEDRYPFAQDFHFFADHPLLSVAKEYAELALSPAGQQAIERSAHRLCSAIGLRPADIAAQRAKLSASTPR